MSYSASLEDNDHQPFVLKVMSELLTQAHIAGIDLEEFIEFFATQIQTMLSHSPNYNYMGEKKRVWIMRGFYPDTPIFFKLTLILSTNDKENYYAKVSPLRVNFYGKGGTAYDSWVKFDGKTLNEDITDKMENVFFGAEHDLKPILRDKVRMPRCMSPKGMKIFRYKKPRKVAKRAKKDS